MTRKPADDPLSTGGALGVLTDLRQHTADPMLGRRLGDYEVTGLIAEGGMGRVYEGRRADGSFDRRVAVKVSGAGGLSDELLSRFVREQRLLAGLNHPNICQLYDAQVTEEGWPYIVMELIDGESIVEFCENGRLGLRRRISLLIEVVDAVAYAHAQLIVHRDIKPANVLVDANGHPKLLDFGIAKLLEPDSQQTRATPLTPRYASPEQLLGRSVTVASDIAQLGLLIHEVLTGESLNASETLASAIERTAEGRSLRVDPEHARELPGEIVAIVEQCLRADPRDRYAAANSLKADLQSYLGGFPVSAVGQSAGYRFGKFVARNMATVTTAGMALVAIVAGVGWHTWQLGEARATAEEQARVAEQEADRANAISQFLIDLFDAPDPQYARGADTTVRDVLEKGVEKIRTGLEGQEALRADLLTTIGRVYNELGELDKVRDLHEEAVAIHRSMPEPQPVDFALALFTQAQHEMAVGELFRAVSIFDEALRVLGQEEGEEAFAVRTSILNSSAIALSRLNRFAESERRYRQAIELHSVKHGREHLETSVPVANLGRLLTKVGNYEQALPLLESSYAVAVEELGPYHPWIAPRAINLGRTYEHFGRVDEAESLLRVALEQDRHLLGNEHHYVASSLQNLGVLVYEHRSRDDGIALVEEALEIERKALGDEHIDTNQTRALLGSYYTGVGRFEHAEALLDTATRHLDDAFETDHLYRADVARFRGQLYLATDRPDLAVAELNRARDMYERLFGATSERLDPVMAALDEAQAALGD